MTRKSLLRRLGGATGFVGLVGVVSITLLAIVGPLVSPYGEAETVCRPYSAPSADFLAGCDKFGQDVFSRLLHGGRTVILLGAASTLAAYAIGATLGLIAGYRGGLIDSVIMRAVDVLLAFPPILFLLVLATGAGAGLTPLVIGIVVIQVPGIARIVRAATLETSRRGYVEAAVARGERSRWIIGREILPNIATVVVADGGTRLTASILLVAAMNFLGLGLAPPAADWSLMISENRSAITSQPWSIVLPAVLIAALSISVNTLFDSVVRARGESPEGSR